MNLHTKRVRAGQVGRALDDGTGWDRAKPFFSHLRSLLPPSATVPSSVPLTDWSARFL